MVLNNSKQTQQAMKKNVKKVRTIVLAAISATFLFTSCKKEDELVNPLVSSSTSVSQPKTPKGSSSNVVTSTKIDESDLVFVEGGTFDMGSPAGKGDGDERPQHKVTLSSYKISKYEITIEQYAKFLTAKGNQVENGSKWYQGSDFDQQGSTFKAKKGRERLPIRFVTWEGARAYANWVGGRVPTEAEWEYAARGGKKSRGYIYSGSNNIDEVAWYVGNSGQRLHAVGEKKPNELGIYDMSGNAWEWTADFYGAYTKESKVNPKGVAKASRHVRRGASAFCTPHNCRSANRSSREAHLIRHNMGFRVVFDVK